MSAELIAFHAIMSFRDFAVETPTDRLGVPGPTCLADFIQAWLYHGHGVGVCLGDFQTFTIAFIAIVNAWLKEPSMLDYVPDEDEPVVEERRVDTIFGDQGYRHRALDPHFFARCTFGYWEQHTR